MPTYQIQFRGDSTANWESENPVLLEYEMGIEVTPDKRFLWKIGDDKTPWLDLPYASGPVGPSPEFEWDGSSIRFKQNDGTWGDWVNLQGPSVEYRWDGTNLQIKNPDGTWGKAVDLQGPEGEPGTAVPATHSSLGGVIVGEGLEITPEGCLSAKSILAGGIIMFSGAFGGTGSRFPIPLGGDKPDLNWCLCDGTETNGLPVPDLRDRMIIGAGNAYAIGAKGGSLMHDHSLSGTVRARRRNRARFSGVVFARLRWEQRGIGSKAGGYFCIAYALFLRGQTWQIRGQSRRSPVRIGRGYE